MSPPYQDWTVKELIRAIASRTRQEELPAGRPKWFYSTVLRDLDKQFRFRFLDLPGELRNRIYRELLDGRCGTLYPKILLASRLLNQEGTSIMYPENEVPLTISAFTHDAEDGVIIGTLVELGRREIDDPVYDDEKKPQYLVDMSAKLTHTTLLKATSIRLSIELDCSTNKLKDTTDGRFRQVNHTLYAPASSLSAIKTLKKITVVYSDNRDDGDDHEKPNSVRSLLYPLCRLALPGREITITGLPGSTRDALEEWISSGAAKPLDPAQSLQRLLERANDIRNMLRELDRVDVVLNTAILAVDRLNSLFRRDAIIDQGVDRDLSRDLISTQLFFDNIGGRVEGLRQDVMAVRLEKSSLEGEGVG